ncbi:AzlD domain-containing protein [Ectothiorhodospira shaposhnikovii]|uniref:AzlD domain-containing protein n=1 Tax=Ectothiorhodospira shaposhnikovii TaxID=1054 RepID=UPI001906E7D9|nr:AzlD domain-containing protein [Ectothiorhodospira shaposhnikovii]MBK1674251.1 hypothetical protein [Ectothiorhodospira shaposhnikovii]
MTALWTTITIIGMATYATRVLPLFWIRPSGREGPRSSWLDRLGPCLLAAMAAAVILPTFEQSESSLELMAVTGGVIAAGASMSIRRDPGLATLVGMVAFYLINAHPEFILH